mmetsp:Transcript_17203/g.30166  ORF Transcript_17203/g.30166 Transcript_17203/m.30166 type:complete len:199 (-) Transcript_17203:165-761(-)
MPTFREMQAASPNRGARTASRKASFEGISTGAESDAAEVANWFFDWDALDKAEARQRTRSLPAKLRRPARIDRELQFRTDEPEELNTSVEAELVDDESAPVRVQLTPAASDQSERTSEIENGTTDESDGDEDASEPSEVVSGFKAWLDQRPPLHRLSTGGKALRHCLGLPLGQVRETGATFAPCSCWRADRNRAGSRC